MSATYPPDAITPAGQYMLLSGRYPAFWIDSPSGNLRFHLMGGQAPWPGLQDGIVCEALKCYDPPFDNRTSQGAHQDGVTYNDTVYDPTEFDFILKTSSRTLAGARRAFSDWLDSWDPKQQCKLTRFTEVEGHWWCYVRKAKPMTDDMTIRKRGQRMTWTAQNDLTFWQSVPSVCTFSTPNNPASDTDGFERVDAAGLGTSWAQTYYGTGGLCTTTDGHNASLADSGGSVRGVTNIRKGFVASTDSVIVTQQHTTFMEAPSGGDAYNDVWARCSQNPDGSWAGDGIRCRFAYASVKVSSFVGGGEVVIGTQSTSYYSVSPPSVSIQCGTDDSLRAFIPRVNGVPVATFTEVGIRSKIGPGFRAAGDGFESGTRTGGGQTTPSKVGSWSAADNVAVAQRGFQTLTNRGDQAGWASHLVYGPGTFGFGDGPGSTNMLTFGPLEVGQIVLVTTLPRLRSIVDVSGVASASSTPENHDLFTRITNGLVDLATFNIGGLIKEFANAFGVAAPQTVLYSLLKGRFNNPIPPKPEGAPAVESHIAVSIKGGNADSKIVSSVTPYKRMPVQ